MAEIVKNETAIYYLNKLFGLGKEIQRLQNELREKTGLVICGTGARLNSENKLEIQIDENIEKLGLPIQISTIDDDVIKKTVELNGHCVFELCW